MLIVCNALDRDQFFAWIHLIYDEFGEFFEHSAVAEVLKQSQVDLCLFVGRWMCREDHGAAEVMWALESSRTGEKFSGFPSAQRCGSVYDIQELPRLHRKLVPQETQSKE